MAGGERDAARTPALVVLGGVGAALTSLLLAALAGSPYLSSDRVNGWILVFAAALFAALFAIPFLVERLERPHRTDPERRWERALLVWGAIALGVLAIAALLGLAGDFSGSSLAGTAGLIAGIEAALVLATLLVWMLSD